MRNSPLYYDASKISASMLWDPGATASVTPGPVSFYPMLSAYTDACRLESNNGAEYRGIGHRIRTAWKTLNEDLVCNGRP